MEASTEGRDGTIFTFYSYKGGVGRTMALANSAALLAKWGHSVLVIDWDLEAPGVERFFLGVDPNISRQRMSKPGVVDLIDAKASGRELDWLDCVIEVHPFEGTSVSVISAGRSDENYISRVQALDLQKLFREKQLGSYLEKLRSEWTSLFDFVLVDSRTGITDIGGICTIHLPDILVLLFTATDPSVDGVIDVLKRSRFEQAKLEMKVELNWRERPAGSEYLRKSSLSTTRIGCQWTSRQPTLWKCCEFPMYPIGVLVNHCRL
jgi:MinD-like ATPase involved in chromosome partitioning or flagellar assembly